MADVTLSYKGSDILELSDSGSATLKTGGKYCEDDIAVEYVKPSGGLSPVVTQYTHVEAWTNQTTPKGTIKNFADTYLPEYPNGVYFVVINNTNTANNAGMYLLSDGSMTSQFCVFKLRGPTNYWSSDGNNFYLGAGSTITTYYYGEVFPR